MFNLIYVMQNVGGGAGTHKRGWEQQKLPGEQEELGTCLIIGSIEHIEKSWAGLVPSIDT